MTKDERKGMIETLVIMDRENEKYLEKLSDERLAEKYDLFMETRHVK